MTATTSVHKLSFEESIETVLEKELLSKLNAGDYLGIMLDETCDITVEKKLAVYVNFLVNGEANVAFVGNEHITDSTAAGIEIALIEFLTQKGISDHFQCFQPFQCLWSWYRWAPSNGREA